MEGCNSRQIPSVRNCFLSISCNLISLYLISLRRMKNIFLIVLICISSLANAQTSKQRLEDIEDKLDLMRAEQDYKDAQRRIEQQNRGSDETPLQRRIKIFGYQKLGVFKVQSLETKKEVSTTIYIGDNPNNLGSLKQPLIYYTFLYEFSTPQYSKDGKSYFYIEGSATMYCTLREVSFIRRVHLDKQGKGIFQSSSSGTKIKDTLEEPIHKYLCP